MSNFGVYSYINKDPGKAFEFYYRKAKLLTLQVILGVEFHSKAESGNELEETTKRLQMCRSHKNFNVLEGGRIAAKINAQVDAIAAAYVAAGKNTSTIN